MLYTAPVAHAVYSSNFDKLRCRVTACMFAKFLEEPSTPEAPDDSLPPRLLQLLPAGTKVTGRDSHPLKNSALPRRTIKVSINTDERNTTTPLGILIARCCIQHLWRMPYIVAISTNFVVGLRPACSPSSLKNPLHQRLQTIRYLHACSSCYRLERKLPDGIRTR
jgi:hypothetical protein